MNEVRLIDTKLKLIAATKSHDCVNMTLVEVLRCAILASKVDIADQAAKAFNVPDKRYWRIKVRALADAGNFDILALFGEKKSPIGYAPFVEACAVNHNQREAALYLPKISDTRERLNCAMKWHLYESAYESAVKLRDVDTLMEILNSTRSDSLKMEVKKAIGIIEGNKWIVCYE